MSFSFQTKQRSREEADDELSSILDDIRRYDETQQAKARIMDDSSRASALTQAAGEDCRIMNSPDSDLMPQEGASLLEELVKFQRQHSINGEEDDIASVISTQLSTQTSSSGSLESGTTSSHFASSHSRGASSSSTASTPPAMPSRHRPQRAFTAPPSLGAAARGSSARREGVYREPLSRGYFLNRSEEEGPTTRTSSLAAFASSSSSPPPHLVSPTGANTMNMNHTAPCAPRRASVPHWHRCAAPQGEESAVEPQQRLGGSLRGNDHDTLLAAAVVADDDEALARRLQQLELNNNNNSTVRIAVTTPDDDDDATRAAAAAPTRSSSAQEATAPSIHHHHQNSNEGKLSHYPDFESSVTGSCCSFDNNNNESTLEQREQQDLEVALFMSRQDYLATRSGKACCQQRSVKSMVEKEPEDDINCSFSTAATTSSTTTSFYSNDDDEDREEQLLFQEGMLATTAKAVASGNNYNLVSCQGCHERLRAPLDCALVYCQGCGIVSPAAAAVGGSKFAVVMSRHPAD